MESMKLIVFLIQSGLAIGFAFAAMNTLRRDKKPEALFCSLLCIFNALAAFQ